MPPFSGAVTVLTRTLISGGRLAALLGARESARDDLTRALTLHPDDAEAGRIKAELAQLGGKRSTLN